MHGHVPAAEFYESIAGFLGSYYLTLALANAIVAFVMWEKLHKNGQALLWLCVSLFFVAISPLAFSGSEEYYRYISMPEGIRNFVDQRMATAVVYSLGTMFGLVILFIFRDFFVRPVVAWSMLNISLLVMGLSMTDQEFAAIVMKPDNVPIVGLVYLLGFFTWLATSRAVQNDKRLADGEPPLEKLDDEKVLVWPDLVYTEMICMVALTALLIVWAIALKAPLEEPASSVKTPNPSKAPWYFLGLQEMLVYFDPWMAGVVLPSLVVFGLMAIPYLDFNKEGNGYYTINQRKFAYIVFQIGFLELWITLIVLGTFLRGPNWNFFGPYEYPDVHKLVPLTNINLSEYFWNNLMQTSLPKADADANFFVKIGYIVYREWLGIALVLGYLVAVPPIMAITVFRKFFVRMGFLRFMLMSNLMLFMAMLPIKMLLRWTLNLKYVIAIPEYFLNL